jgi:hypothetical protein
LETRSPFGVTARYRRLAATAAARLGRAPRVVQLDTTSGHVEGRDNRDAAPAAPVVPSTRGYRRDPRPDVNPVMVERVVAPHAGIPRRMPPRSGHSRAAEGVGAAVRRQVQPWHTPDGLPSLVADRARSRAATRAQRAPTPRPWSTRVPATVRDAPAAWAHADPPAMVSRQAGDRAHALPSPDGGVAPRGVRISSAPRQAQAPRTMDQPWRKPRAQAVNAWKPCCGGTCACAAEARQALATVA